VTNGCKSIFCVLYLFKKYTSVSGFNSIPKVFLLKATEVLTTTKVKGFLKY